MCLGPKEAMFKKPKESTQHLNPLYIRGHIDGKLISRMIIDGGTAINLMSYPIFKKLGREDDELMKTNLMLNGMGGNLMEAQGVISMELTIGSKSLATAFFIVEVQGNYSVILDPHGPSKVTNASNDNFIDDDPNLLKFDVAEFEIICRMNSQL
jgi:hypothetical protein